MRRDGAADRPRLPGGAGMGVSSGARGRPSAEADGPATRARAREGAARPATGPAGGRRAPARARGRRGAPCGRRGARDGDARARPPGPPTASRDSGRTPAASPAAESARGGGGRSRRGSYASRSPEAKYACPGLRAAAVRRSGRASTSATDRRCGVPRPRDRPHGIASAGGARHLGHSAPSADTTTDLSRLWAVPPVEVAAILLAAVLYWGSTRRFGGVSGLRQVSFYSGLALILAAVCSPLGGIAQQGLLTAHMLQHTLIGAVAPLLLLLGMPASLLRHLPERWRRRIQRIQNPLVAFPLLGPVHDRVAAARDPRRRPREQRALDRPAGLVPGLRPGPLGPGRGVAARAGLVRDRVEGRLHERGVVPGPGDRQRLLVLGDGLLQRPRGRRGRVGRGPAGGPGQLGHRDDALALPGGLQRDHDPVLPPGAGGRPAPAPDRGRPRPGQRGDRHPEGNR